ncbi:hypothetical protein AB0B06_30060 [Streptomyces sp. NPDC044989]|uniref:hypothetical protein n=1 Tax=Streptomyces sp. NPDC044989 TaxID=3154336 RepID=UPI0034117CAC
MDTEQCADLLGEEGVKTGRCLAEDREYEVGAAGDGGGEPHLGPGGERLIRSDQVV